MINKVKNKLTGDKKILILFIILGVFNILFVLNVLAYLVIVKEIDLLVLHNIGTIISAFIILSFISTRLPKLKQMADGTIYEIGYLIIMGLLSLTISYFNKSTHGDSVLAPFIEMFRMLSVVLIFTYIATKSKSFKAIVKGDRSRKTIFWQIVICTTLAILASYFTMDVNGVPANSRGLVVMIASLLGGPALGLPVGIISGVLRMFMGGPTAFACGTSTIIASIVGSVVYIWNGGKFLRSYKAGILMFLFSGFDMFMITALTPRPAGMIYATNLYAPMTFASVLGILLFTLFLGEKKKEEGISSELKQTIDDNSFKISTNSDIIDINTDRIISLSQELEKYKAKVDESELELQKYKDKVNNLESELKEIKSKL